MVLSILQDLNNTRNLIISLLEYRICIYYNQLFKIVGILEDFKEKVIAIRKTVENFKGDYKMANEAISTIIESLPPHSTGLVVLSGMV